MSGKGGIPTLSPWRRRLGVAAVLIVLAFGVWVLFLPLGIADAQHLPGRCPCGDPGLQVWFLAADRYAVVHHHFSLLTTRIDYPLGVNLMDNTSMPFLGVLATPLISAVGPVGTFVFLLRLGFFLSATSCFLVLRRYVHSILAAGVGAALYGLSPYMFHQGGSHLFLVFVPIPPILVLFVQSRLFRRGRRPYAVAVGVGLLGVVQGLISSEVLVTTVLILAVTVAVLGVGEVVRRQAVWPRVSSAAPMLAVAVAVVVAGLGYPAWSALRGPQHIRGPTQPTGLPGIDALSTALPATRAVLAGRWPGILGPRVALQGATAFLGIPLLVILVIVVVTGWRSPVVRFAAVFGVVAWVFALGPHLLVDGHATRFPLPFRLLQKLPVLQDIIPSRLTLYVFLAASILLAIGVDRLLQATGAPHWQAWSAAALTAVVGLVLVMPVHAYPVVSTGVARYFIHGQVNRLIPVNGVALTYPYSAFPSDQPMVWQADSGLRFSMLGGYAVRPTADGLETKKPSLFEPYDIASLLRQAWGPRRNTIDGQSLAQAATELPGFVARYHVTTLLVERGGEDPDAVVGLFTSVYGPPRGQYGRLDIWSHLHARRHHNRRHRRTRHHRRGATTLGWRR